MDKVRALLVASLLLMAACGGGAASSNAKARPVTVAGAIQLNSGADAGSDLGNGDVSRGNPMIKKDAANPPPAPIQPQAVTPAARTGATPVDRCSTGFGTGSTGNQPVAGGSPKEPPLPMCAPE